MLWISLIFIHNVFCEVSSGSTVSYKTTIIDSPVDQVLWCGGSVVITQDDDTVKQDEVEQSQHKKIPFVLSNKGILYRSLDYGFQWENVTETLRTQFDLPIDYHLKDMHQSPADSNIIFLIARDGGQSFKTLNCGRLFMKFNHQPKMFAFKFNKMNYDLIIALQDKPCKKGELGCKEQYKRQLFLTENGGGNWRLILDKVKDATWDKLLHYELVPDERILAAHFSNEAQVVSSSDDFFETKKIISKEAFGFYQTHRHLFLLVRPDELSKGYDMLVQPAFADNVDPEEIILPLLDQNKHTFTVLDANDAQIFMSVSHHEDLPKLTNIYMSHAKESYQFTVSLLNNVRSQDTGLCDFEHIKGIEGVVIANVYEHSEVDKFKSRRHKFTTEKETKDKGQFDRLDAYKRSVISYDRGAEWHPIKAPKLNSQGELLNCNGDCSLHLRGKSESITNQIYSGDQSIGIIIGTGNSGLYLSTKDGDINTYLSRDGGHNWYQMLNGSYIYEIGDHGSIIVMAEDTKDTNKIVYTWDEGLTYDNIVFVRNFTIEVDNIVTEPSNMEQKFLLYGRQDSSKISSQEQDNLTSKYDTSNLKGVLVALDFTALHQRVCTGQWDPSMPESDYEFWTPINYEENKCLFGKKIKYSRRKRDAKCFNPEELEKEVLMESCECTHEDWECDVGYHREIDGKECIPLSNAFKDTVNKDQVPLNCVEYYQVTRGYKKLPNDFCEGGIDLSPIKVPCPNPTVEQTANLSNVQLEASAEKQKTAQSNLIQFFTENANILVIVLTLIALFCFRVQVVSVAQTLYSATRTPKEKMGRNYYPISESEDNSRNKDKSLVEGEYEL